MKKLLCFLIISMLFTTSCETKKDSPLSYQRGITSVSFTISLGDVSFDVSLSRGELTVLSPDEISGVVLRRATERYDLIAEDGKFELPEELIPLVSPIFSAFSLPEEKAQPTEEDGKKIAVEYDGGEYIIELSESGDPTSISYSGRREFTLYNIALERGGE